MTRQCVEFTGIEDGIVEPNENFTVTLTSNDDVNLNPDVAVVTIVEGIGKRKLHSVSPHLIYYISVIYMSLKIKIAAWLSASCLYFFLVLIFL